ncbi:hypothetical protein CORC01_02484 [Colletotrichum orchidophilum]|uniref:Uncharacterized protein n=1 Tax=Colletotrichum orchidophilum TaxID=1209926 RepID=A0A1G4BLB6_9PEZI|nr:uncharacterized protein CORC01_02484 [Colletotrichum orchidophilum]OHF02204.1 hypothetical protein CORC01_02484 [Colletotrichum orchidophilum]
MNQYVEAPVFIPSNSKIQDSTTTTGSSEDLASSNSPSLPCRRESRMLYNAAAPSPLRPALRLGCQSPRASINSATNPNSGWSTLASPHSFEQLYTEKPYLTASLSKQGEREIELMRRLSVFQEKVDGSLPSDERRRARKNTTLLKSKIFEATAQKKAILMRLGDIYVELQSRETWMQIQNELYERRCSWWSIYSPSTTTTCATTPSDVTSMIPTPLDAASSIFFPAGCHPVYNTWDVVAPRFEEGQGYQVYDTVPAELWTDCGETSEVPVGHLGNHGLQFEYEAVVDESRQDANKVQDPSSGGDIPLLTPNRRKSLPSLKSLWPGLGELRRPSGKADEPAS